MQRRIESIWSTNAWHAYTTNSQNMQAAKRCQLDVLHGRRHERAVGGFYPTAFSSGCLRKRPSNLLQTFALQNISGCKIM